MNPVSSSVPLRSLVMFGAERARCWGEGEEGGIPTSSPSDGTSYIPWTTPAFPILFIRRRLLQEGYDEGFASESGGPVAGLRSLALALNIKTLYMFRERSVLHRRHRFT
ncbi:unnamed protein product [Lasius platythorax]|uniref:Uncharacterized protein n=1 Tax=Lasius platythorax TaxID=488582 RepID=A0AAV2N383_9HYME